MGRRSGGRCSAVKFLHKSLAGVKLDVLLGLCMRGQYGALGASLYYGHAWGKGVVDAIYPGQTNGQFMFLETNYHF